MGCKLVNILLSSWNKAKQHQSCCKLIWRALRCCAGRVGWGLLNCTYKSCYRDTFIVFIETPVWLLLEYHHSGKHVKEGVARNESNYVVVCISWFLWLYTWTFVTRGNLLVASQPFPKTPPKTSGPESQHLQPICVLFSSFHFTATGREEWQTRKIRNHPQN